MDCDTTGVEPELALIKYKKLVGGGILKLVNNQVPSALNKLGYSHQEVEDINSYMLEKETIEGAPHLKDEHLPVFDCSFKASNGKRSIHYMGHVRMMSAAQPFISGAISKTVNLPTDATREDVSDVFYQGWKLGLKAIAVYRDGSKSVQPLNTKKDDEEKEGLVEKINGYRRVKLPDERPSVTHKFSIAGYESYLTVGFYPDTNQPGETFLTTAKEGSTISGLLGTIATLVSICLQSGVPLKVLVRKFKDARFEPSGFTNNPDIQTAKSIVDYVFRYMGLKYLSPEDRAEIFGPEFGANFDAGANIPQLSVSAMNTHIKAASMNTSDKVVPEMAAINPDAPACANCGTLMFKAGSCYSCPNCFATTGVCN
jgi:ribonucleoside-diphosphate reductase alpha chain